MSVSSPIDELREPPPSNRSILIVGLAGVSLVLSALIIGLATNAPLRGFDTHKADGPRMLLCVAGLVLAGCAISMNPRWYGGWLCGAAAGLVGYGVGGPPPNGTEWYLAPPRDWYSGVPVSWDSIQLFFGVAGAIGIVGAIWTRLPKKVVLSLALVGVLYHFSTILAMITSPPPTPWVTMHFSGRVVRSSSQFMYFQNAYQFYSPDPGPACELWVCIEYRPLRDGEQIGDPVHANELRQLQSPADPDAAKDCEWFCIPTREEHYIDPLGLKYYRRMSITENAAHVQGPGYTPLSKEQEAVIARRIAAREFIPNAYGNDPNWASLERRVPNDVIARQVLPSYARHLAASRARPGKQVHSVRIYRALHMIVTLAQLKGFDMATGKEVGAISPYHPSLYLPYFQGKFSRDGQLVDSTDQMLYWLVPIIEHSRPPLNDEEYRRNGGFKHYFTDYVSIHAGCERPIKERNR